MPDLSLISLLEKFVSAWNAHDVEALMECMTPDDCVFYTSADAGERGNAFIGFEQVKKSYEAVFQKFPDGKWNNAKHFVSGNRGLSGDLDEGLDLMERALHLNPAAPCWYRIVPYFKHYLEGNYETALNMALFLNTPSCFWDPRLRAAAYGQLGMQPEGEMALKELYDILPDFESRPMRYIHGIALKSDTTNLVREGLIKAGMGTSQ